MRVQAAHQRAFVMKEQAEECEEEVKRGRSKAGGGSLVQEGRGDGGSVGELEFEVFRRDFCQAWRPG